jgi:hypothetical protein
MIFSIMTTDTDRHKEIAEKKDKMREEKKRKTCLSPTIS